MGDNMNDRPSPVRRSLNELLGPFVAWMATQNLDEGSRRSHRHTAERFLRWSRDDDGPVSGRRRRYEQHVGRHEPGRLDDVRAGLDRWAEHRLVLARTLPR